ncbi:cobaltochelatase subunit CobN [Moritella viscosa]|uniref:Cobaltochelatase subunit CobN n=1 Tax=Moritella viscosa TaxID=80854 RepID=A0ABY1HB99_9GAMM|nr:cobaltochelatase subunit CobN [Moritella viscosa]SGY89418.1 Cobaltochelatase [Moritella viscosa]SGY97552.1 Cobaltochelatase [Moritella viscosa]SHO25828.1 Cobaltochelatase [Moritella viscosa]
MHLLAAQPGGFTDDEGIIDLEQSPADIVILSAADSSLAALASGVEVLELNFPSIRLANWMQLLKPAAFDLYQDKVLDHAKVVVVSLLGGENYWQYGFEQLQDWLAASSVRNPRQLIIVPGDDSPDEVLFSASSVDRDAAVAVWRYLREGGEANIRNLYHHLASQYLHQDYAWRQPQTLPNCMLYMPKAIQSVLRGEQQYYQQVSLNDWQQRWLQVPYSVDVSESERPICLLLFYRSHLQSDNTAMFDGLIDCIEQLNMLPLPIAIQSLKDDESIRLVNELLLQTQAKVIINTTGFSCNRAASPDLSAEPSSFISPFSLNIPVLQLVLSSSTEQDWLDYKQGLRSRDIAMQVVLPEMDGRIQTRAVSFKTTADFSERCQTAIVKYQLHRERAEFVVTLAFKYCQLSIKANQDKRTALIIANYPTKDGRIGNGVGLDTPESTVNILTALAAADYPVENIPENGTALINELLGSITNNPETLHHLGCWQSITVDEYMQHFQQLPIENQQAIWDKWGGPDQDPKYRDGRLMLSGIRLGQTFVGIQPARGFNIDLAANYHDPDLIPPHSYLAFYFWLRHCYQVDAVIHVGKHGNLEWLPGKGNALSEKCWPDLVLGPMPNFYPFIVNDPGEGAQAKRRIQSVIIDHLMPPMTRAEVYGELAELEGLVDEYYQAMGMDEQRERWLREAIVDAVKSSHVAEELGGDSGSYGDSDDDMFAELDTYLCDIKEAQIRHGLHILGVLPQTDKLSDTIVALLRLPRGKEAHSQGILHNLALDLNLQNLNSHHNSDEFDPLAASSDVWQGARPSILAELCDDSWRTEFDTRERLELLAIQLVSAFVLISDERKDVEKYKQLMTELPRTIQQLSYVKNTLLIALEQSVENEISALLDGLAGLFVKPGPSGAPTRGRLDTLPTGRNFFSVDNRSIPSPAAWAIGQRSTQAVIERHLQEHGDYPKQLGLSVWGTATMRTGGDDIAQAFALMGIKPIWAQGSQRVIDFEIIPCALLGRPRVDVTLRVSGFFRDAFPNVMKLFDAAVLALANYDDPGAQNTIQQNIKKRISELSEQGMTADDAKRQASYRVFGSKPGAYGAGLQGLIDERCWELQSDLADAYLNWGGYAYGSLAEDVDGVIARGAFANRLSQLDVVMQNQDNREHDLLDSDDYYQFQGGMTNAVRVLKDEMPVVYHNDHSNPAMPKIRTLKEELNRVIRSRVLNPKWIEAMREHGYKGAFEMAASIDYMFAYDATTNLIDDYQYEKVADALIFDQENQAFMQENNVNALEEMAERLLEATQRGLWQEPGEYSGKLQSLLLDLDAKKESSN